MKIKPGKYVVKIAKVERTRDGGFVVKHVGVSENIKGQKLSIHIPGPRESKIAFRPKKEQLPLSPPTTRELRHMARYLKQPCSNLDNSDGEGTNAHELQNAMGGIEETIYHLRYVVRDGNVREMAHLFKEIAGWAGIASDALAGYEPMEKKR